MRVSLSWLSDYVDIKGLSAQEISDALTNAGLEVESIETVGGVFSGVVVGFVKAVEQHPNADRLRLVTVSLGQTENQVVCGAPNVALGQYIAYAQLGAQVVNKKEGGLFTLTPAKIRGVESTGMICSLEELGLEEQFEKGEDGIWPLNALANDSHLGQDLKTVLDLQPDTILDVAPTANRGDQMSMIGVAREVAALFNRELKLPKVSQPSVGKTAFGIALSNPSICQYYAGATLSQAKIAPSPQWLKDRLTNAGVRSINNVVDITNYVMLETGQPLHAFDAAKLGVAGNIDVRYAKSGETFAALDETTRQLHENLTVAVTHNDNPVALGGVMGGAETEIDDNSSELFLEVAFFPSASNRRSARSVGIRTESSARFERGIDPLGCELAMNRAISLLIELSGATLTGFNAADHREKQETVVSLPLAKIEKLIGVPITTQDIKASLTPLGFEIVKENTDSLEIKVPSFRTADVSRPVDIIEELIRIYGYDKIPYTFPAEVVSPTRSVRQQLLSVIRKTLAASGLSEVTTHSLIGPNLLQKTGFTWDDNTGVAVSNSNSQDHTLLRQTLLPNLLEITQTNQAQGNDHVWIFELGRTYSKAKPATEKESGVAEPLKLAILLMGNPTFGVWKNPLKTDFYTAKGVLENLLAQLNVLQSVRWMPESAQNSFHPGQTVAFKLGKQELGVLGRVHPLIQERLKLAQPVFALELNVETLYAAIQKQAPLLANEALSAYPSVQRDIAFASPLTVSHQDIQKAFKQVQDPLVQDIQLFDEYTGHQVGEGNRSLAFRVVLQSQVATLTDAEIDALMHKLKEQLAQSLGVLFR